MQLLVVRHAIARERDPEASDAEDFARPLTSKGARRMKRGAAGLHRIVPNLDLLASSPLVRAAETAKILSTVYHGLDIVQVPALVPGGSPELVGSWLKEQRPDATIAVVGHEPNLGILVGWLVSGLASSLIEMRKGSACMVNIPGEIGAGKGTLQWLLTPGQLRRLRG